MNKMILPILILVLLNGCATITGPGVSREEIIKAQEELQVKALGYQLKQLSRVNDIGYRLISSLPIEDLKQKPDTYLGIYVFDINKYFKQLYNLMQDEGVVVGVVIKNSPAEKAGVSAGDVLISINNIKLKDVSQFQQISRRLSIAETARFQISRSGRQEAVSVKIGSAALNIPIVIVDIQEVNAAATPEGIFVTYGLMHFVKSEDEIAAVLGHELAHIVRGHLSKAQGSSLLGLLIGIPLGIIAENVAPGTGEMVMRTADAFRASYSRDLEREADYFGTKYVFWAGFDVDVCANFEERFAVEIPQSMIRNYLSTHPSSPERMLRIRKTIAELKSQSRPKNTPGEQK